MINSTTDFIEAIKTEVSEEVFYRIYEKIEPMIVQRLRNNSFDLKQAAEYIGSSESMVRTYCRQRKIKFYKIGNQYRIRQIVLDEWMSKQEEASLLEGRC